MDFAVFRVTCSEEFKEIFIAECGSLGFDMMEETASGIEAFVPLNLKESMATDDLLERYAHIQGLDAHWDTVETVNWNEEWEKNYDPVNIDGKCLIRAPFHPADPNISREVIIYPKMSFGTGHHSTTYLMVQAMLEIDFKDKSVLDAGCGTGVLAIFAELSGSNRIDAYDISDWCIENTQENMKLNNCKHIRLQTGTVREVELSSYDLIFANINKNALLDELGSYKNHLKDGGRLYLSGFFDNDSSDLINKADQLGLSQVYHRTHGDWAVLGLE